MTDPFDACRVAYEQGQRDALASMDGQSVILASECEKQNMAAYELGRTDGILLGEEKAHRDSVIVHEGAAERRGYEQGQRDALNAAVQRVEALRVMFSVHDEVGLLDDVIAAIKGDQP
jgi:hypothetical protein